MAQCWRERPADRPDFQTLSHWLLKMITDVTGAQFLHFTHYTVVSKHGDFLHSNLVLFNIILMLESNEYVREIIVSVTHMYSVSICEQNCFLQHNVFVCHMYITYWFSKTIVSKIMFSSFPINMIFSAGCL